MRAPSLVLVAATALLGTATAQFSSTVNGAGGTLVTGGRVGSSSGKGSSFSVDAASAAEGKGDPILSGFDGRTFEFFGEVGNTYNLLSEANHQLSTRLKAAHMWDHNGTYMEAFSLRYREHAVEVVLGEEDSLAITVDGQPVTMLPSQTEAEHILGLAQGELQLHWQLHKAGYGNAVEVSSEMLQLSVWVTPAGTVDEGGFVQPAYLNFDLQLLGAPQDGQMHGIIGQSFMNLGGEAEADDWEFHHPAEEYEMAGFSDAGHPHCLYQHAAKAGARRLLAPRKAAAKAATPLKASAGGPRVAVAKAGSVLKASATGPRIAAAKAGPVLKASAGGPRIAAAKAGTVLKASAGGPRIAAAKAGTILKASATGPVAKTAKASRAGYPLKAAGRGAARPASAQKAAAGKPVLELA